MKKESQIGRRIRKSDSNSYGWIRNLKRGEVKFNKPVILCLPGDGTQNDNSANAMAKEVETLLGRAGIAENDIQILSVHYPEDNKFYSEERKVFADNIDISCEEINNPEYIKDIYVNVLQPLVINSKGQRNSFDEAQKKFRQLTLFSHCHGTFVASKLMNYLTEEMKKYNYSNEEINLLCEEIVNIGLSPRMGFHRKDGSMKFGFTMLDDGLNSYSFPILVENAGDDCVVSKLTLGLEKDLNSKSYMYISGDNLKYNNIEKDQFLITNPIFMHSLNCYTDIFYAYQNYKTKEILTKNNVGMNLSKLIIKVFQNAVSLSKQGIKRTEENIVSNETPITFKQGEFYSNHKYINVNFIGDNNLFEQTLIDYRKDALDKRFNKANEQLETEEESDNILVNILNRCDEK